MHWHDLKDHVTAILPLSHDVLHIHLGLATFLVVAWLFRFSRTGLLAAWGLVLALELVNEAFDAMDWIGWTGSVGWRETAKDVFNTMLWPTIFALAWGFRERVRPER